MLGAIANGEDPRETKRAAVKTAAKTVEVVAAEFIKRHAKVHNKPRTWAETERLIAGNVIQGLGQASDHQHRPARRHRSPGCGHRPRLADRGQPGARRRA